MIGQQPIRRPQGASDLWSVRGSRQALSDILESWRGTPHRAGQCRIGPDGGVDCVHFVWAVLEAWRKAVGFNDSSDDQLPRYPQDMGVHTASAAKKTIDAMRTRFPCSSIYICKDTATAPDNMLRLLNQYQPGDILALRMGQHANHAAIVGARWSDVWHAMSGSFGDGAAGGVAVSSLGDCQLLRAVHRAWRPLAVEIE